ncbi:MAG: TRAP transporter fused permease subunit [Dehalobacterium sp.]
MITEKTDNRKNFMDAAETDQAGLVEVKIQGDTITDYLLKQRSLSITTLIAFFLLILSVMLTIFHLSVGWFGQPEAHLFRSVHLCLILAACFLYHPLGRKNWYDPIRKPLMLIDLILVTLSILTEVYYLIDPDSFAMRLAVPNTLDLLVGITAILLVLEGTRRVVGWPMVIIALVFTGHSLFADKMPGILFGPAASISTFVSHTYMEESGIYGIPIAVVASFVVLFIVFGALLRLTGGGKFFVNLALAAAGSQTGGPAKAAVISSMLFGSISGSTAANVVGTGTFTIPLMKEVGYPAHFAGAVEAVSSTGGALMPPIMGAVAFVIAGFLGISYWNLALAALIPALIFYGGLFAMIHFRAQTRGLWPVPKERLPRMKEVLNFGWTLLIPLMGLIGLLASGRSASMSVFWAIVLLFVMVFINKSTRPTPVLLLKVCENVLYSTIVVSLACACAGIIVSATTISGIGLKLSWLILDISGSNLFFTLILIMLLSIVLGMGLPTTAVYITLYVTLIPTLVELGVVPLAAHMFALYYGVLSNIIPPVAIAAYAAAGVAKSEPMKTSWTAFFIGLCGLLVPFAFVYRPELLLIGSLSHIIWAVMCGTLAVFTLAAGVIGWFKGPLNIFWRILILAAGLLSLSPGLTTDIVSFSIAVIFMIYRVLRVRRGGEGSEVSKQM